MSKSSVPLTALGSSGIQVSRLALGSWRTYERISRDQGIRVLFGATRPEQVVADLGALTVAARLTPDERERLAAIGARPVG